MNTTTSMTDKYGAIVAKIRTLCARPIGVSQPEIVEAIGKRRIAPFQRLKLLMDSGEVVRSGVYGEYRYFTEPSCAEVYDLSSKAAQVARHDAARKRANATKAAKDRAKRASAIKVPRRAREPRNKPAKALKPIVLRQPGKSLKTPAKAPTITWPEHVKVQVAPTPKDSRFTFDAPEGWKGQITRDWMDRRLQDSCSL